MKYESEEELLNVLMKIGGEVETVMEDRFENLADHFKVDRQCRADYDKELNEVLKTWRSIS